MNDPASPSNDFTLQRNIMTSFIQITAVALLVSYCFMVIQPFLGIVIWGVIMAVAIYPLHLKFTALVGNREKLSATLIATLGLLLLLVPGWFVADSSIATASSLTADIQSGSFKVPPPDPSVADWPIIGDRIYRAWSTIAISLDSFFTQYSDQVKAATEWLLSAASAVAIGLLHFTASIIIAAVCLMYAKSGYLLTSAVGQRIAGPRGSHLTDLSISTIRSVTNGVLGVALIQAGLAGIGFAAIDVPAPGILTLVILVTAIIQIPAILIMLPLIIWVYSFAEPLPATIFAVYSVLVALSDNLLKPLLLGRGVDLPVLVVLLGAIGGMVKFGVIGLFLGAVILGLGYRIITDWIWHDAGNTEGTD